MADLVNLKNAFDVMEKTHDGKISYDVNKITDSK
jgi:hypothetical protein